MKFTMIKVFAETPRFKNTNRTTFDRLNFQQAGRIIADPIEQFTWLGPNLWTLKESLFLIGRLCK